MKALSSGNGKGVIASSLQLAGFVNLSAQTLPDDASFHTVWSIDFKAGEKNLFILTGNFGNATTPGCSGGDYQYSQQVLLDGANMPMTQDGFLTFTPGKHTIAYQIRGDCPGNPVSLPGQTVAMIPFRLP